MEEASSKSKFVHIFSKVLLHSGIGTGISRDDGNGNSKSHERKKKDTKDKLRDRMAIEAFLVQLFAGISSIKAAYGELQLAQFPFDPEGIQTADRTVVAEFKNLSELRESYLKKQLNDTDPETSLLLSEIQEVKSLQKIFEIMIRKLDSELQLKDSEITFLREKLADANEENKLLEKKLYLSGQIAILDSFQLSDLKQIHFITYLRQTVKSIQSFTRVLISEMESAGWNLDKAANAVEPRVIFCTPEHRFFAFESFVCKEMFNGFNHLNFQVTSMPEPGNRCNLFFNQFTKLKSEKLEDHLASEPQSPFSTFFRAKYLELIHPKMEVAFFGNTNQRNLIESGIDVPDTPFFFLFGEMAKRVWLLHCLGQAFDPPVSIFMVSKGSRFSEVYMESIGEEGVVMTEKEPRVALAVVPGFQIGKTVIQCQVYLE